MVKLCLNHIFFLLEIYPKSIVNILNTSSLFQNITTICVFDDNYEYTL